MSNSINYKCPVCDSLSNSSLNLYDDRYGYNGIFSLYKCIGCGHKYLDVRFLEDEISQLYTQYYPRHDYKIEDHRPHVEIGYLKSWINGSFSSAFRWVPKKVRVLDIGCGSCEAFGYHKARGCEVFGIEADMNVKAIAERYNYNVHIGSFDYRLYEDNYFDYVTMDQVIEHISDPIETMRGVSKILKRGGTVILSTPNSNGWGANIFGKKWINWHVPYHQQFFTPKSMKILAVNSGLMLEKIKYVTNSEWLFYQWNHLLMFPKGGAPSSFWSSIEPDRRVYKLIRSLLFYIHRTKINHFVSRLFDHLHLGDNYIFFLKNQS